VTRIETVHLGDRSLFPELEVIAYCNHAGISPASAPVQRAVQRALTDYGRGGMLAFPGWQAQRERLREKCARLLGAQAKDVALTPSTTRGISDVALSLPWVTGDRVVVFEGEFPTNVTP
jgi:cysteine desulfurase/selenocysteine lyase